METNAEAQKRIDECRATQATELDLSNLGLTAVSDAVTRLDKLTYLNLSNNQLSTLPDAVAHLPSLISLNLSNNQLSTLPDAVACLDKLTDLYLSNNQLSTLPNAVARLQSLMSLDLSNNQLSTLPDAVARLDKLTDLYLSNNQLSTLPDAVARLQSSMSLDLSNNQLSTLPDAVTRLDKLTDLDLSNNQLSTLPDAVARLDKLTDLDLRNNQLSTLPDAVTRLQNLRDLSLSNNQLSTLPDAVTRLDKLTDLSLSNNQLSTLPDAVTRLQSLMHLYLSNNQLSTLPDAVTRLQNLMSLNLSNNQLSTLPDAVTRLDKLTDLDLSNNQLSTLPDAVTRLDKLTYLDLSNNQLSTLPDAVTRLDKLTDLRLSNNQLSTLPDAVTHLDKLTYLYLRNNQLSTLPDAVTRLDKLTYLSLSNNQLSTLPDAVTRLDKLTYLDLRNNQLSTLPDAVTRLDKLTDLDLSNNQLSTLPDAVTRLDKLTDLDLSNNQLSTLPDAVTRLDKLTDLDLSNNQLSTLPDAVTHLDKLTYLDLSNNQLSTLPSSITQMDELQQIEVTGNPDLISPPPEVIAAGKASIRAYFAEFGVPDRLFEAKLLLVGEPHAGKTSLKQKLLDPACRLNPSQPSTEGIDIQPWLIPQAESGLPQDFRLNLWDFGGQEIYKATHQFFLTRRSIYLFVVEARKHEESSSDIFYFWFNVVQLLGGASPLLVVQNKCDQPTVFLPMSDYRRQFANILPNEERVSCADPEGATIPRLRARIVEIVRQLYHEGKLGMELPASWVAIRQALAQVREQQGRDTLTIQEYLTLCAQHGLAEPAARVVSHVLHELGVLLHFHNDWLLQETLFLNHEWVTHAVYRVLDNREVIGQRGRFSLAQLAQIWREPRYQGMQQQLLSLMRKFELCYELPNGEQLAPQLLPGDPPAPVPWRSDQNNLHFVYAYDFMPRGILARLIVRLNTLIYQEMQWYYGVLLEWGGTRALLSEERGQRRLVIRLEGGDKRGLLAIIRHEVEAIHQSFGRELRCVEKIPCHCPVCANKPDPHYYNFAVLQSKLQNGKNEVACDRTPHHDVKIQRLISDVFLAEREEEELGRRRGMRADQYNEFHFHGAGKVVQGDEVGQDKVTGDKVGGDKVTGDKVGGDKSEGDQIAAAIGANAQNVASGRNQEPTLRQAPSIPQPSQPSKPVNNAWLNGAFYLVVAAVLLALLGYIGKLVAWYIAPVLFIVGLLGIGWIGALQLKHDQQRSEKGFLTLMLETYKRLPLLKK